MDFHGRRLDAPMTRVCLVGEADSNLRYELLSRETARAALATYDLREPFVNTVGVETVSLGAAVSLLNDLNWYLVRFADAAFVLEPSVSEEEWLSRPLAEAIRDDRVDPAATGRFLRVYGVERPDDADGAGAADAAGVADDGGSDGPDDRACGGDGTDGAPEGRPPRLVEPMLVARTGETIPAYDLREVDGTLVVRVTESEFDS
jgi:hypothetical protein